MVQINNSQVIRSVVIYSATGQKLLVQLTSGSSNCQVDMSRLPTGMYLLQIMDVSGNVRTVKLLKK